MLNHVQNFKLICVLWRVGLGGDWMRKGEGISQKTYPHIQTIGWSLPEGKGVVEAAWKWGKGEENGDICSSVNNKNQV